MTGNLVAWGAQALILVAMSVLAPMLLRLRSPRAGLWISQAVLVVMLLLPFVQPRVHPPTAPAPTVQTRITAVGTHAAAAPPAGVPVISLPDLGTVLIAGVLLRLVWLAIGMVRLARCRRNARPVEPDFAAEDVTGARAEFLVSLDVPAPVTFGWRRPVVVVPPSYFRMPENQRHAVACHELLHVRRRDWLSCLAEELAAALMWFHPAVWFLIRRIRSAREQVVDAEVIRLTRSPEPYVEALLAAAVASRPMLDLAVAPLFIRSRDLTRRVQLLMQEYKPMSRFRAVASTAFVTAALAGAGVYATLTFPLQGAPQTPPGMIARTETRGLPDSIKGTVESMLSGVRGQAFTTTLMNQVNADLQNIDPNLTPSWVEERPGEYSISIAHKSGTESGVPRVAKIDATRLPQPQQAMAAVRLGSFLHKEYSNTVVDSIRANAEAIDKRIAVRWRSDPDGAMVAVLMWELPPNGYQPVSGVLSTIDTSALPDEIRARVEAKVARFRNAPLTNALMDEIRNELHADYPSLGYGWETENGASSLKIWSGPGVIGGIIGKAPIAVEGEPSIRIGSGVLASKRVAGSDPDYPALARQARIQGIVKLQVGVGKDGSVKDITLISGHPVLVQSAVNAVKQWQFEPTLLNGQPTAVFSEVEVPFRLQ